MFRTKPSKGWLLGFKHNVAYREAISAITTSMCTVSITGFLSRRGVSSRSGRATNGRWTRRRAPMLRYCFVVQHTWAKTCLARFRSVTVARWTATITTRFRWCLSLQVATHRPREDVMIASISLSDLRCRYSVQHRSATGITWPIHWYPRARLQQRRDYLQDKVMTCLAEKPRAGILRTLVNDEKNRASVVRAPGTFVRSCRRDIESAVRSRLPKANCGLMVVAKWRL